jgi:peptide/nickel transport system permease protein
MLQYILRRILLMLVTLLLVSVVAFIIIQLPPGDFATSYISALSASGATVQQEALEALRTQYGLDQPVLVQYGKWIWGIITRGDFGISFSYKLPVSSIIWERVWLTVWISLLCVLITWLISFPIGIYSAVKQYSPGDYLFTLLGFIGVSVPSFLVALVVMYIAFKYFSVTITGLFSSEFVNAPWSGAKVLDLLGHLWLPVLVLALEGTAGLIRTMRANLLDELRKPYVVTARAKGLPEWKVILKYPVRLALNPFVSTLGWLLPGLVSGSIIISVVMSLPTTGPLLLSSLLSQDMYLAGTIIMLLSALTIIGTLLSDILLAWLDPRIRLQ